MMKKWSALKIHKELVRAAATALVLLVLVVTEKAVKTVLSASTTCNIDEKQTEKNTPTTATKLTTNMKKNGAQ